MLPESKFWSVCKVGFPLEYDVTSYPVCPDCTCICLVLCLDYVWDDLTLIVELASLPWIYLQNSELSKADSNERLMSCDLQWIIDGKILAIVATPLSAMEAATMVVTRHDSAICQNMKEFINTGHTKNCDTIRVAKSVTLCSSSSLMISLHSQFNKRFVTCHNIRHALTWFQVSIYLKKELEERLAGAVGHDRRGEEELKIENPYEMFFKF